MLAIAPLFADSRIDTGRGGLVNPRARGELEPLVVHVAPVTDPSLAGG